MKKIIIPALLASLAFSGVAFAQADPAVTSPAPTTSVSSEQTQAMQQIKALREEMNAKIKAIKDEYAAKISAIQQSAGIAKKAQKTEAREKERSMKRKEGKKNKPAMATGTPATQ